MDTLSRIKEPVSNELKRFDKVFSSAMKSEITLLNVITNFVLRRKGKQIRPLLIFLTAKLNGTINESTYTAASLAELLHTATLIHDDVVDEAYERRGFLSLNAIWKSKIAVLLGDYLLSKSLIISVERKEHELLEIFTSTVKEIIEGEIFQIQKSRKLNIREDEYFDIIKKKTASLLSACAAAGATSVKSSKEEVELMKTFGLLLGTAFQIKDDLFDYEISSVTGKPRGNDIQEKKLTLPLIAALQKAGNSEKRKIIFLINQKSYKKDTYNKVFHFVHEYGGLDYSRSILSDLKNKCENILIKYPVSEAREALFRLINYVIERDK